MAGLQYDDDWDSEEFQTALKVVLKCEIQSLLERLSETGEETVLLTASAIDLTVGHLASANALKFVDTADVGLIKNKFLCYLAAGEIQADVQTQIQNVSRMGTPLQGPTKAIKYGAAATSNQNVTHLKSVDNKGLKHVSDMNITSTAIGQPLTTTTTGQPVKRALDSKLLEKFVPAECKRRKVMVPTPDSKCGNSSQPNILPVLSPPVLLSPSSKCTTTTHIALSDDDSSSHSTQSNKKSKNEAAKVQPDVKLKTTKVSSKSGGFTEERLLETEFMKFVKQCKSDVQEIKDDNEEHSQNKHVSEGNKHVSEGSKRLQQPQNISQVTNQPQSKQFQQKSMSSVVTGITPSGGTGIAPIAANKTLTVSSGDKSVVGLQMSIPVLGQTGKPDTGAMGKTNTIKSDSPLKIDISKAGIVLKESDKENKVLKELAKPMEVKTDDKLKQQVLFSAKVDSAHTVAKPSSENEKKSLSVTGQKQEAGVIVAGKSNVSDSMDNIDEIDTETLISITKAKHLQKMTEADKLIQEKIGKLSNLNWVVEYPKEVQGQRPQQVTQSASMPFYQGMMTGAFDDEEEDDEDMDDEEFDEDEFDENDLDEEDRATFLKMRAHMVASENEEHFPIDGGMGAHMSVSALMAEEFEEGIYENEEEYDEYGDEDIMMHNPGNMHDAGMALQRHPIISNATNAYYDVDGNMIPHSYQRSSSLTQDSFLMLNTTLGKCLVCSKIVRISEMKQHNLIHIEDEDDYDYDDGEEEFDEIDESENIGGANNDELGYDETEGEHFDEHLIETCEDKKALNQDENESEFIAERFVAAKIPLETGELDRSTVCDICNKTFKSRANMIRHQKVHTDLKIHCPVGGCSKNFRITNYLMKHVKKMHPEYKGPIGGEQEEGFKCGVCGKVLNDEDTLAEHLKIHT